MHLLSKIIYYCTTLYMYRTVFPSIIRSSKLRIQQRYMSNSCCYLLLSGMRWNYTRYTCYLKSFILVKRSTCFGRSFRPSSGAQNCVYNNGICQTAAASSSCLTYTVAVYAVLSSRWWTERPSETCRAFYKNKWFEIKGASCWLYYRNIFFILVPGGRMDDVHNANNKWRIGKR